MNNSKNKIFLVAKREYFKNIRKPAFWLATLALPALIIAVGFVSGYSTRAAEKKAREELANAKEILVLDKSNYINPDSLTSPYVPISSEVEGISKVKSNEASALFIYPENILESRQVTIHAKDPGLTSRGSFQSAATNLLKNQLISRLGETQPLVQENLKTDSTFYLDGEVVEFEIGDFIVPGLAVVMYFFLTFLSSSFLLLSVSEEKENRMMEIILSILTPKQIIWGKIFGLIALALTQLVVLVTLAVVGFQALSLSLPFAIDLGSISIDPMQILLSIFYATSGFLLMATIMVGTGSAMPTYREAQSFTSIFIMLSIFPIYFASLIISDPTGPIAMVISYFPFTAPLVLLARNALGALGSWEILLSLILLPIYVIGGFYLAFKLFELGSLEYSEKITSRLFKRK